MRLPIHRKAAVVIDFTFAGKETHVEVAPQMRQFKLKGFFVMIKTLFAGVDELCHHAADNRRVFVLVAAGSDGHVKALHV